MGRIFERFGNMQFRNEAEVSQNFLIPLLTEFFEYEQSEILPEHVIPAFDIPQNRNRSIASSDIDVKARPDFVITVDGKNWVFACDSKASAENLDDHLRQ